LMTKPCSRVFEQLWRVEPTSSRSTRRFPWKLSTEPDRITVTAVRADLNSS
jgi:hypothetical protein